MTAPEPVLSKCPVDGLPMDAHCKREAGCLWDKCPDGHVVRSDGHVMGLPTPWGRPMGEQS